MRGLEIMELEMVAGGGDVLPVDPRSRISQAEWDRFLQELAQQEKRYREDY